MNQEQIKRLFPNASKSLLAANDDHTNTPIPDTKPAKQARALDGNDARKAPRPGRPFVCFTLCRTRLLDVDAKHGSCKDLLDGLRYAGLIHGDREEDITFDVEQRKVAHRKDEQTIISITYP